MIKNDACIVYKTFKKTHQFMVQTQTQTYTSVKLYNEFLRTVTYLSPVWKVEHHKFMTSSNVGRALGDRAMIKNTFNKVCDGYVEDPYSYVCTESGLIMERMHQLFILIFFPDHRLESECPTQVNPYVPWMMSTPDGLLYDKNNVLVATVEYKTPYAKCAALQVPDEHMPQLQINMQIYNVKTAYYGSLRINEQTKQTEYILHRVQRNDIYLRSMYKSLIPFLDAVVTSSVCPVDIILASKPRMHVETTVVAHRMDLHTLFCEGPYLLQKFIVNYTINADKKRFDHVYVKK